MQDCFLYNTCNHKDCDKDFCIRKYKLNFLYNASLLSDIQRQRITLSIDSDGTDLAEFKDLATLEQNIVSFVSAGKNLYLHSTNCGCGKAQPDGALILCKDGYKRMADIAVGDLIYGEDGQLHAVIDKFDRGIKPVYAIEMHDGSTTTCCDEHLWTVYDHKEKCNKTITLQEIMNCGLTFKYATIRNPSYRFDIPVTKSINFEKKQLNINPYLLGYLLGDGYLSKTSAVNFSIKDDDAIEVLSYLNNCISEDLKIIKTTNKYTYNIKIAEHAGIKQSFGSFKNSLKTNLDNYKLLGCTSYNKFIPNEFKYSSESDRIELLRGLMDTDGTVSKQAKGGCQLSYSTVSKQLAEDIAFLVCSLGGTCSIRARKGKTYIYKGEKRRGHVWYNCTLKLPKNSFNPFRLKRKAVLYDELHWHQQRDPYRALYKVDYIGDKHCYCIMTDNPTHLYLTDNLIVTHNTSWAVRLMQAYFNKIWPATSLTCRALFISVPRFLLALKDNISTKNEYINYIKENIMQADLVVWDDIATKVATDFELNHLLSLIDGRIALGKANIYTSNLGKAEMCSALGERLASRVCQYSKEIELHGADKRSLGGNN